MQDYRVSIGDSNCTIMGLTDNVLICKPQEKEPNVVKEGYDVSGKPNIYVSIFAKQFP